MNDGKDMRPGDEREIETVLGLASSPALPDMVSGLSSALS